MFAHSTYKLLALVPNLKKKKKKTGIKAGGRLVDREEERCEGFI